MNRSSLFLIGAGRPCMGAAGALAGTAGADKKVFVNLTKILCIVLCFTVLFMVVTTPIVHAEVVALGLSLACTALIIVLLTSMGMKIQSNNAEDLDEWMTGKIIQFPGNGGNNNGPDWLNVVSIAGLLELINGKARVPSSIVNKVSEFGEFLMEDEGIVAGGQPVGQIGTSALVDLPIFTMVASASPIATYNASSSTSYANKSYVAEASRVGTTFKYNYNGSSMTGLAFTVDTSAINSNVSISTNYTNGPQLYVVYGNTVPVPGQNYTASAITSIYKDTSFAINKSYKYASITSSYFTVNNTTQYYLYLNGDVKSAAGTVITPSARIVELPQLGPGQYYEVGGAAFADAADASEALTNVIDDVTSSSGYQAPAGDPGGIDVPDGSGWLYETITDTGNSIVNGIGGLFVPRPGFWEEYVDNISDVFDDRMGILTYPLHVMTDFVDRISEVQDGDHKITWPDICLNGVTVIRQGEYDFDDILENESLEALYDVYIVIVKAIILGLFISLCWRKLEEIEQS